MLIYSYDENTKEFLTVQTADIDKKASERLGEFVPLIPANATLLKPPTSGTGKKAVFKAEKWIIQNDYRGKIAINPETDELEEIDYLGELKEGFVFYDDYVKTTEYKEKQESLKQTRLLTLAMKPIDFINAIETIGVNYTDLTAYCQENTEADKYLKYSDLITRGDEFLNDFAEHFNISSEKLDNLFKKYGG